MNHNANIAAVILSGGKSTRMGSNKAELSFAGINLLQRTKSLLKQALFDNIFVSSTDGIIDVYKDKGPLGGIHASLLHLKNFQRVLFIPIDMPLLNKQMLIDLKQHNNTDIAHFQGYNLPLLMANNQQVIAIIERQIENDDLSIYQLFNSLETTIIPNNYDKGVFINTNDPEQWRAALIKLASKEL
jgi:molybdopterin-guanine dinucleotide biosynthesis protein A